MYEFIIINKGLVLFFRYDTNLFSNQHLFVCFFSLLIIIKYDVLFRISYYTHTHNRSDPVSSRSNIRQENEEEEDDGNIILVLFLFLSHPPTHRQTIHWQEKRKDSSLYVLYNIKQRRHIIFSLNLFSSCHFLLSFPIIIKSHFGLFLYYITYTYNNRIKSDDDKMYLLNGNVTEERYDSI